MPLPPPDPEYLSKAVSYGPGSRYWQALRNRYTNTLGSADALDSIEAQFGENLEWFDDSVSVSQFLDSPLAQDWRSEPAVAKTPPAILRSLSTTRTDAVPLSDIPTTTANPERPRTLAAGYDPLRSTMTVVFRDGTYYNYYDVSQGEWNKFRRARSKGGAKGPIDQFLNAKRRGRASGSEYSSEVQEVIYRIARTAQLIQRGSAKVPMTKNQGRPSYGVRAQQKQFQRYSKARGRYVVSKNPIRQGQTPNR
jgi:hypothetical protein